MSAPPPDVTSPPQPVLAAGQALLRPRKALPFYGRHPWVLDSAVQTVRGSSGEPISPAALAGQTVDLLNDKQKFVARGIFNGQSRIRVRLYSWDEGEALDAAFWKGRLTSAIELRRQLGYEPAPLPEDDPLAGSLRSGTAARLVFSEADGLGGLIVDRYGDYLVVQATSLGMAQRLERELVPALAELLRPAGMVLRVDKSAARLEGMELHDGRFWGEMPAEPITILEHGLRFQVDLCEGQKTGFYLDQRENRRVAATYMRGRQVLDMFCYTGGFALAAAKLGGARSVLAIDSSKRAIAQARLNAQANGVDAIQFQEGDGFESLDALLAEGRKFGAVVLDPPKFARNRAGVNEALMAYHRINRAAVDLLEPGGILVTCSCSGSVSREDFLFMLSGVAQKSRRDLQVLELRGAAPDHPVSATCLETEYLKCAICRVV